MKISKLQINNFGKISDKEIELKDGINIIKGQNESGKSTIQKFITSMFYGISKDKRKSDFTDYDKYFPWDKESFSGKINYILDDGKKYEVYRDFTKKMPVIYNENAEDITKQYSYGKTKGSNFFEEQTGVDEKTMLSSMVSEQSSVVIDQSSENFVIQKIANLTETGDEKISYEKAQNILTKKRNEEVGTEKTKNRPINLLEEKRKKLLDEKIELNGFKEELYEVENKIEILKNDEKSNQRILDFALKYKSIQDENDGIKNKIAIYDDILKNNKQEEQTLNDEKDTVQSSYNKAEKEYEDLLKKQELEGNDKINKVNLLKKKNKKKKTIWLIAIVLLIVLMVTFFIMNNIYMGIVCTISLVACLLFRSLAIKKIEDDIEKYLSTIPDNQDNDIKKDLEKIQDKLKQVDFKLDLLKKNTTETKNKKEELNLKLIRNRNQQIEQLLNENKDISENELSEIVGSKKINEKVEILQDIKNNNILELQKNEYRKSIIMQRVDRLAEIQEQLYEVEEQKQELDRQESAILLATETLEEAYQEMKDTVVPIFTKNLSSSIDNISNGKYKKVVTNDKEGLLIQGKSGEYIPAKALSIGTIDQLYLSLRFAITNEATTEKMPIILDEAFAYYDNQRLINILKYISESFKNNQIIIFTCTSRECESFDKLNIDYNLINI